MLTPEVVMTDVPAFSTISEGHKVVRGCREFNTIGVAIGRYWGTCNGDGREPHVVLRQQFLKWVLSPVAADDYARTGVRTTTAKCRRATALLPPGDKQKRNEFPFLATNCR